MIKIKIKILWVVSILAMSVSACQNNNSTECNNLKLLLDLDSSFVIKLGDKIRTAKELVDFVKSEKCNEIGGVTGPFEINYSFRKKHFVSNMNEEIGRIQFLGYICPMSLTDYFFDDFSISINSKLEYYHYSENEIIDLESIKNMVFEHIGSSYAIGDDSSVSIILPPDMEVEKVSNLIWEILQGYLLLLEDMSQVAYDKEFCNLSIKELTQIKKNIPLNLWLDYQSTNIQ